MDRVIVTQCHVRFGFNVARSLARAGYQVVAGGQQVPTMCRHIAGVVHEFQYPSPFADPPGYVEAICRAAEKSGAGTLLPVHEDIFVAARDRASFPRGFRVLAPPFEALMRVHDKLNLSRIAAPAGIGCPSTRPAKTHEDVARAIEELGGGTVIAKPRFGEGTAGVFKVRSVAEAKKQAKILDRILAREAYILQPFIDGVGIGVGCLLSGGSRIAACQHLRLREVPLGGGTSTARLTHWDERLVNPSFELMEAAGLDGVAMLEYRHDRKADKLYLLDVNPRYWGGLSTHIESGVDFPRLHLDAALRHVFPAALVTPSQSVETRWTLGELRVAFELLKRFRLRELQPILFPDRGRRIVHEEFASGGMLPFLVQAKAYLIRGLGRLASPGSANKKALFFASACATVFERPAHDQTQLLH